MQTDTPAEVPSLSEIIKGVHAANAKRHQARAVIAQAGTQYPPLESVTAPSVPTDQAAFYLLRQPQTLRGWACSQTGPIQPVRVHGRLGWPTAKLREMLGVEVV